MRNIAIATILALSANLYADDQRSSLFYNRFSTEFNTLEKAAKVAVENQEKGSDLGSNLYCFQTENFRFEFSDKDNSKSLSEGDVIFFSDTKSQNPTYLVSSSGIHIIIPTDFIEEHMKKLINKSRVSTDSELFDYRKSEKANLKNKVRSKSDENLKYLESYIGVQ